MNSLIKREKHFILLLLTTTRKQQLALVKTVTTPQLQSLVQIIYNVVLGNRFLPEKAKKKLQRYKTVIRRFITKGISQARRRALLLKYLNQFILLLKPVIKDL